MEFLFDLFWIKDFFKKIEWGIFLRVFVSAFSKEKRLVHFLVLLCGKLGGSRSSLRFSKSRWGLVKNSNQELHPSLVTFCPSPVDFEAPIIQVYFIRFSNQVFLL